MYVFGTCVPDFPSSLHIRRRVSYSALHRHQSLLFELPLLMKVQKVGFQNLEDEALLVKGGSASVRYWYTRTYNVSAETYIGSLRYTFQVRFIFDVDYAT